MQLKVITEAGDIPLSKDEWNALVFKNETNTIFQTYEWFESWWKTFGKNYSLYLILVYKDSVITGFAPFMLLEKKRIRELLFIGDGNSDYMDFVLPTDKEKSLRQICDFLSKNNDITKISLNNIPEYSSTSILIKKSCHECRLVYILNNDTSCPTLLIEGHHEETKKLINKYSNKRPFNYFRRQGTLTFRHLQDAEIERNLEQFFRQHISRWGKTRYKSLFTNIENQVFYRELAKNISATGWLLFSVTELNGKPISYHFGFEYDNKIIWYKPSFEIQYSAHSPGKALLRFLIQYALNTNKTELDFTIGDESFKSRFKNKTRYNSNIHIYNKSRRYWSHRIRKIAVNTAKNVLAFLKRA